MREIRPFLNRLNTKYRKSKTEITILEAINYCLTHPQIESSSANKLIDLYSRNLKAFNSTFEMQ